MKYKKNMQYLLTVKIFVYRLKRVISLKNVHIALCRGRTIYMTSYMTIWDDFHPHIFSRLLRFRAWIADSPAHRLWTVQSYYSIGRPVLLSRLYKSPLQTCRSSFIHSSTSCSPALQFSSLSYSFTFQVKNNNKKTGSVMIFHSPPRLTDCKVSLDLSWHLKGIWGV